MNMMPSLGFAAELMIIGRELFVINVRHSETCQQLHLNSIICTFCLLIFHIFCYTEDCVGVCLHKKATCIHSILMQSGTNSTSEGPSNADRNTFCHKYGYFLALHGCMQVI